MKRLAVGVILMALLGQRVCLGQTPPEMRFDYALDSQGRIRQVIVYRGDRQVQALDSCTGVPIPLRDGLGELAREDFNFDGYLDLTMRVAFDPRTDNSSYCVWLYDPKAQAFALSTELSHLTNPTPDPKAKTVVARENQPCSGSCYVQDTYKWRDGRLKPVREESVTEDPLVPPWSECRWVLAEKAEKNGELVERLRERVDPGGVMCEPHAAW